MNLNFLDLIYEEYTYYCLNCGIVEKVEEVEEFSKKYIKPLLKQNSKDGMKMEEMFNCALAESDVRAFKNGFRTCMHFVIDYLKGDL